MNHDPGIGQTFPLPFLPGPQQKRTHARSHTKADSVNRAGNELHRIVDRQPGGYRTARRVNVQSDGLGWVLIGEEEELGDQDVRVFLADLIAKEQYAVFQKLACGLL